MGALYFVYAKWVREMLVKANDGIEMTRRIIRRTHGHKLLAAP